MAFLGAVAFTIVFFALVFGAVTVFILIAGGRG